MNRSKLRMVRACLLALVCAVAGFLALFLGHTNHLVAVGVALLAFALFAVQFNRAWATLGDANNPSRGRQTGAH